VNETAPAPDPSLDPRPRRRLTKLALQAAQPLSALLELTYRCNWRCVFCYNPRHHDRLALSAAEWSTVLDDLRALGTLNVTVTGGEPLARPDTLEILAAVRARKMAFRLFTNGALVTRETAARLAELHPVAVELSLHGATAGTHDAATQTPGSFEALFRGLNLLLEQGLPTLVKTPLTRLNEHELDAMSALVEGRGLSYHVDPTITPRDDGDLSPQAFRASPEGMERLYRRVAARGPLPSSHREAGGVNCGLGRTTLAVDPEGNVYPCPQWRWSTLGNVRETRLLDLWAGSPVRQEAAAVARQANDRLLAEGGTLASFPFCPALAAERTGDPLGIDPLVRAQAEAVERVRLGA
jgi:MoaA/NifB/PqqE/SkfB family radical SAM enzyme